MLVQHKIFLTSLWFLWNIINYLKSKLKMNLKPKKLKNKSLLFYESINFQFLHKDFECTHIQAFN